MINKAQDLESIMSPFHFTVNIGGRWKYAYTKDQIKAGVQGWGFQATAEVEAWLVKPVNDGTLHKRSELMIDLKKWVDRGYHIVGIAQNLTDKFGIASDAYIICDAFPSRNGQVMKYKWTASPRKADQEWNEYLVANSKETYEAVRKSGIDDSLSSEDLMNLYFKLEYSIQKGDIAFAAIEKFDESHGKSWNNFIEWSKLSHLREVISLDTMLCPNIISLEEHISYNYCSLCDSLEYLLSFLKNVDIRKAYQVVATIREPTEGEIAEFNYERFVFKGFDLQEWPPGISALTNCGGFDLAFTPNDLNDRGLVAEYSDAYRIRESLRLNYPDASHADCDVWAIWRLED